MRNYQKRSYIPIVYIVVPLFNRIQNLPKLFSNLESQTYQNFRLILVDHGTKRADTKKLPGYVVHLQGSTEDWWSGAINIGLKYVFNELQANDDDYIMLQNDDVDFGSELIEVLLGESLKHNAVVGAITLERGTKKIIDANNRLSFWKARHVCKFKGKNIDDIAANFLEADVLKGRGVLYPVKIARKIGNVDEKLHYRADPEWSYRAKKLGCRLGVTTKTAVETTLDTQEKSIEKKGFSLLWYIFFSKRSTQNIPAAWRYFCHCFGAIPAVYAITFHFLFTTVIFFLRPLLRPK